MKRLRTGISNKIFLPVERRLPAKISQKNVKLCELCGTLNYEFNPECWTCRWHGSFSYNAHLIALAWQRLENLYEEVRPEHVSARRARALGDFGTASPPSGLRRIVATLSAGWQRFLDQRDLRMAQRQARLHSRMPSPPDQLGV